MSNNRIAVLVVSPCRGSIYSFSEVPNHHRYTLFERREKTDRTSGGKPVYNEISTGLLRYENKTIEKFLEEISVRFRVGRGVQAHKRSGSADQDRRYLYVEAEVSGDDRIIAHSLGECEGYDCYAIYKQSDVEGRSGLTWFGIHAVPDHGRASVVYQEGTMRDCFTQRNITQTLHHEGNMPVERQLALYDWMNERIKPIMEPMIALLAPPEDCR